MHNNARQRTTTHDNTQQHATTRNNTQQHAPPPPPGSDRFVNSFLLVCRERMDESSGRPSTGGVGRRRRERRLRSWLRHEQQTVRMALVAASHHSAQQNAAPRGPKTGARAREVEEQVTHVGLRAQKTPPPGERPGILPEPLPQRSDRSRRRFSGDGLAQLAMPSLAGAAGEAVDAAALAFLISQSVAAKEHEDRRRRRRRLGALGGSCAR